MKYRSVHAYLDAVLKDLPHPTSQDIKNAKREYWKLWYKYYRREKRRVRKEFTLGFDTNLLAKIHNKRGKLSVSEFLYESVYKGLNGDTSSFLDQKLLENIHLQLMQLISLVEEAIENELLETESLQIKIEDLEQQFEMLINSL